MTEIQVQSKLMTLSEVAVYLRVTEKTIHRLLDKKGIPATRVGKLWRFDIKAIDKWLNDSSISGKARILVIDNNRSVRMLFEEIADKLDNEIVIAESCKAGLKLVEGQRFNLFFLDMAMLETEGIEAFVRIKNICPDMQVVMMSGTVDGKLMSTVLPYGFFGVLNKPLREADILQVINSAVRG